MSKYTIEINIFAERSYNTTNHSYLRPMLINASIVLYNTPLTEVQNIVRLLRASEIVGEISLIDNSPHPNEQYAQFEATYTYNNENMGYGRAHNIALRQTCASHVPYHLIVNADIDFQPDILSPMIAHMEQHPEVGQMMPQVYYPDGSIQHLCKLLPTPFILIGRRFVPARWTKRTMERFELRRTGYDKIMNIPYLSGCFMLLRTEALRNVGLFDERYFMYPEDIDLTRRIHRQYQTLFYPMVSVTHNHSQSSYKSKRMLWIHITNLVKYFNKWGWICDSERRKTNQATLQALGI